MKKYFISLLLCLVMIMTYAQSTTDKVLTGVGSEVTALHTDAKDAISTLHQDAQAIVATAYTDGKGVLSTLYEDANKIVKYAAPKLEAGLIALAQTLKTTVQEVYTALIMKQVAIATSYSLMGLLSLLFGFFVYKILCFPETKLLNSQPNEYGKFLWKPQWAVLTGIFSISSLGLFIGFVTHFQAICLGFIAPKAGAIMDIVQIVDTLMK